MKWNPKYYIVYPRKMIYELKKPDGWGYLCSGDLPEALQLLLNTKAIGGEMKLIWNEQHRWNVIRDNKIEYNDLEDYIKSDCSMISFKTEFMMNRALKKLKEMGSKSEVICVDNYRDVILNQANFKRFGKFLDQNINN